MSLALTVAMVGGVALTQQVNAAAQLAPGAPHISVNGTGQALVFPYYTVRGGYKSFFNVTNTSNRTVPIKVRFREGLNSRDALDFIVVLSPYDVWTGWVEDSTAGPVVKSTDKSCTVGAPDITTSGQPLSAIGYNYKPAGPVAEQWADQGDQTIDRTREGYVEIIAMGQTVDNGKFVGGVSNAGGTNTTVAYNALHRTSGASKGIPRNCARVDSAFKAPAGQLNLPVPFPFTDNVRGVLGDGDAPAIAQISGFDTGENPLKGNFSLIDSTKGIGAGNAAIAIADFMDPAPAAAGGVGLGAGTGLVTAQNFPYFLEPTLASRGGLWNVTGLPAVDFAMATQTIANEWANNADTGAETAWVVNFPTKSFYVDDETRTGVTTTRNIQAAANRWRVGSNALVVASTGAGFTGTFGDINADGTAVPLTMYNFDREEQYKQADPGATQPSPAPVVTNAIVSLYREAGIITFGGSGLNQAQTLPSPAAADLNAPNGWTSLSFNGGTFPAVGYAFKLRNQGDAAMSYGQIMSHSYGDRTVTPANVNP